MSGEAWGLLAGVFIFVSFTFPVAFTLGWMARGRQARPPTITIYRVESEPDPMRYLPHSKS